MSKKPDFKVSSPAVSNAEATIFANELEQVLGEILNGKRKPQNILIEPMIALIKFSRDKIAESDKHWKAINIKNSHEYVVTGERINCTNAQDGEILVDYEKDGQYFARKKTEFAEKFKAIAVTSTPKQ
jgi:hypothetical protein